MAYQGKGELAPIMAPGRPRGCGGAPPRDHVLTRQAGSSLPLATTPLLTVDSSCRRPTGRSRRSSRMPANQSSAKLDNLPWLPSLHRYGAGAASLLGQAPVLRNAHGIGHAVARDRRSSPEIGATTYGVECDTDGTAQALLPPDISWQIRCSNSLDRFLCDRLHIRPQPLFRRRGNSPCGLACGLSWKRLASRSVRARESPTEISGTRWRRRLRGRGHARADERDP